MLQHETPRQQGASQSAPVRQAQKNLQNASFDAVTQMKERVSQPAVTEKEIKQAQETLRAIDTWFKNPTDNKALAAVADAAENERKLSSNADEKSGWGDVLRAVLGVVFAVAVAVVVAFVASFVLDADFVSPISAFYMGLGSTSTSEKSEQVNPQQPMGTAANALRAELMQTETPPGSQPNPQDRHGV